MFDPSRRWPFNLDRPGRLYVALAILVLIAAATLVDAPVAWWAKSLPGPVRGIFEIITRAGTSDWFLIPALVIAPLAWLVARLVSGKRARALFTDLAAATIFMFVGTALPGLAANLVKRLVGRSRPVGLEDFGIFHFEPLSSDWRFQSFPSGDTTTIFAIAVVVSCLSPRLRIWAFGFAALVGLSRIMVGMHFPSDVLGGLFLGTISAYAVRNVWLARGWIFHEGSAGAIVRKPDWSQRA